MKGKVLVLCLIATAVIIVLGYKGYLTSKNLIEVKAYHVNFNCGERGIDLRVTAVNKDSARFLVGKTITPELTFDQTKMNKAITELLKTNPDTVEEFVLIGFIKKSKTPHCSGSECFEVKKVKLESANEFIEF